MNRKRWLTSAFICAGGYEAYRDELHSVCDGLSEFDEMRVFMAHGWVSAELGKNGTNNIEFLRYERTGEGQLQLMRGGTNVERVRQAAEDITEYTERTRRLFRKIYAEQELEHEETQRYSN
jgi:hypothetical protein